MTTALDLIEARAHFGGIVRPVYLRVAEHEGCIYVNLCDTAWRAVEIPHGSLCAVDEPPVRFCRRSGMLELPEPVRGGSLDELDKHLRMNASGYTLTKAWLLAALRPRGPYPVLAFTGEQGTASLPRSGCCDTWWTQTRTAPRATRHDSRSVRRCHQRPCHHARQRDLPDRRRVRRTMQAIDRWRVFDALALY